MLRVGSEHRRKNSYAKLKEDQRGHPVVKSDLPLIKMLTVYPHNGRVTAM